MTEIWAMGYNASAADIAPRAQRYEDAGFDGYFITDSQNLWKECWVALTTAACPPVGWPWGCTSPTPSPGTRP